MPRARKKATRSRPLPKKPEGDEGSQLTEKQRREKVELFIADFEREVQKRVGEMKAEALAIQNNILLKYNVAVMQIPKDIQQMTISEFREKGGTIESVQTHLLNEQVQTFKTKAIPEQNVGSTRMKAQAAEGKKKPVVASARRRPPRQCHSKFQTPAMHLREERFDTPLVTPKFDPRLPITPAVRGVKQGEIVMSMHGSPLAAVSTDCCVADARVPIGDAVLQVRADMDHSDIKKTELPLLDDKARSNIEHLQSLLQALLDRPK